MQRLRVSLALTVTALWVVFVELLPGAHLAMHSSLAAHTHDGAATIADGADEPTSGARCHGDDAGAHCHRAPRRSALGWDRPADLHDEARAVDPPHGAESLAHRGLAFQRPTPSLAPLAPAPFVEFARVVETAPRYAHPLARASQPRGPPA